jgi:hypothetical protein
MRLARRRTAALLALPGQARSRGVTHGAFTRLVPLIDVGDARPPVPEADRAGIRCAALTLAQDDRARRNPGDRRPNARARRAAPNTLSAAGITLPNRGMDISRADSSARGDAVRQIGLDRARFVRNARDGSHPWNGDPLILGDTRYCDILNR